MNRIISELKKGEAIRLIECSKQNNIVIKSGLITDGDVVCEIDKTHENIKHLYLDGNKYDNIDTFKTRNIILDNYSYAIRVLLTNCDKNDFVLKNVEVFLKDIKDKKALAKVSSILTKIDNNSNALINNNSNEDNNDNNRKRII